MLKTYITKNLHDLFALASLESESFIKPKYTPSDEELKEIFANTPATKHFVQILKNYEFIKDEFNGSHALFGTIENGKKHKNKIQSEINNLKQSRETAKTFNDKKTQIRLSRLINIFEMMLDDADLLISKLVYFVMFNKSLEKLDTKNPLHNMLISCHLSANPLQDSYLDNIEDMKIYLEALKLVEGHNLTKTVLLNNTIIKAYKNYELAYGKEFCENKDFIYAFESIFDLLGETIYLSKYDFSNIYLKTFFRDIAIFDFKGKEKQKDADEEYFNSLRLAFKIGYDQEAKINPRMEVSIEDFDALIEAKKSSIRQEYLTF